MQESSISVAGEQTKVVDAAQSHAAVFHAANQPMTLVDVALPELHGGEVLVRITCATICGSDLHTFFGRRHSPAPCVLGHEMVGNIIATGPDGANDFRGRPLSIGARVTWSMVWSCGECFYCRRGLQPKCERLLKFGHETIAPNRVLLGGMAQHCFLPTGTAIFRVPETIPDTVASPANCATSTVAAVLRATGDIANKTVVVLGAGMLGITACAMAVSRGASQVMVIEPDLLRCKNALRFGATADMDAKLPRGEIIAGVCELTKGRGADVVLDFAGHPEAIECGFELLCPGGRLMLAGAVFPSRPVQISAEQIVRRLIRIEGVYNYSPEDLESALQFLASAVDRYPFAELVEGNYSLDDVNEAFAFAEKQRPPRVAVIP